MVFFSILIPVYNAEKYIEETVKSILNQTEQDFEIFLLDDGSTDNSRQICMKLAQEHPEIIRFDSQINTGVLIARRNLAELAKGQYLIYVDSDDLLVETALSAIKNEINRTNADVVMYDLQKKAEAGDERYTLPIEGGFFEGENKQSILRLLFLSKYSFSMCQKAIKRDCFDFDANYDNVRNMRIAEDVYQSFPILDRAEMIAYIKEPLYIYRKNSAGATATVKLSDFHWNMVLFDRQNEYIKKWNISTVDVQKISENRLRRMLGFLSVYARQKDNNPYSQFKDFAKDIKTNKHFYQAMEKADSKHLQKIYRIDLVLLKLCWYRVLYWLHRSV